MKQNEKNDGRMLIQQQTSVVVIAHFDVEFVEFNNRLKNVGPCVIAESLINR